MQQGTTLRLNARLARTEHGFLATSSHQGCWPCGGLVTPVQVVNDSMPLCHSPGRCDRCRAAGPIA
eukprot:2629754-Amphidinium_carterae.1